MLVPSGQQTDPEYVLIEKSIAPWCAEDIKGVRTTTTVSGRELFGELTLALVLRHYSQLQPLKIEYKI